MEHPYFLLIKNLKEVFNILPAVTVNPLILANLRSGRLGHEVFDISPPNSKSIDLD